ncbi:MAG: 3-phosphoserine/phosphohydroxythreonine transaminase [Christensenellaceae bacterium]
MKRVFNFAAGPSALPLPVLARAQEEMLSYNGTGMSVMEMSHRSPVYEEIIGNTEQKLRQLMCIPDNYKVLFLQGGASMQFTMVPMNLMWNTKKAYYLDTGNFAHRAVAEGKLFGEVIVAASSEDRAYAYIPELTPSLFAEPADYVHMTTNNTIYGTRFTSVPPIGDIPLVSDMSSCILSEVYDVNDYGLIYAGAQKNIGPAGVTVVIVRDDLLGKVENLPSMLDYAVQAKNDSMFNTPPTYGVYLAGLVFEWLEEQGGVAAIQKVNEQKAALLYNYIDNSKMFKGTADKPFRSMMNVTFVTGDKDLDTKFVSEASAAGLMNLKGHRVVGGMRASIYNAVSLEAVEALANFMADFEAKNA